MDGSGHQDAAGVVPEKYRSSVFQLGGVGESPAKASEQYMDHGNGKSHHNENTHDNVHSAAAGVMKPKEQSFNPITWQAYDESENGKSKETTVTMSHDKTDKVVHEKLPPAGRNYIGRAGGVPPGGNSTFKLG